MAAFKDAALLKEQVGVENGVDAVGDPFGVEDVGVLKAGVFLVAEDDAQLVQEFQQGALADPIRNAALLAEIDVGFIGEVVNVMHAFEGLFDGKPVDENFALDVIQLADFLFDEVGQLAKALAGETRGRNTAKDIGIFDLQAGHVDVERMLVGFVADNDDGGVAAKALDDLEPVFETVGALVFTDVENQEIETAAGEKELVGGVHDLLTAKVPNVDTDRLAVYGERPGGDGNAGSF